MKRVLLFVATNLAVLLVLGVVMSVFGITGGTDPVTGDLDLVSLLVFAGVIGMGGSLISLAMSKTMAKMSMGVQILGQPRNSDEQWLLRTVAAQAERAGIGMPEVGVFDSPQPNAFATGMNRNSALVAVSSGLLRAMNRDEVEAVLAHEVSHVANGDMVTLTLIQGVVNTFVIFASRIVGHLVDRAVFKVERGHGPGFWITSIVAQLVLGVLASMIVMWFSRWREFRADAGGAALSGRHKMIAALQRLKAASEPPAMPDQFAAFGVSGRAGGGIARLFMSHPPLAERIARLRGVTPRPTNGDSGRSNDRMKTEAKNTWDRLSG